MIELILINCINQIKEVKINLNGQTFERLNTNRQNYNQVSTNNNNTTACRVVPYAPFNNKQLKVNNLLLIEPVTVFREASCTLAFVKGGDVKLSLQTLPEDLKDRLARLIIASKYSEEEH